MESTRRRQIVLEHRPDQHNIEETSNTETRSGAEQSPFEAMLDEAQEFDWDQVITF